MNAQKVLKKSKNKLLIVGRNPLELAGLKSLLPTNMEIEAETSAGPRIFEKVEEWRPNIILLDFDSYENIIDDLTRRLKREYPEIKILWLLLNESDEIKYEAISTSSDGCVLKTDFDQISQAVEVVQENDVFYPRQLLTKFIQEICLIYPYIGRKITKLTEREREVLQFIRDGATNEEIAGELHISVETVKAHIRSIRETLGISSRRQIINQLRPLKRAPRPETKKLARTASSKK